MMDVTVAPTMVPLPETVGEKQGHAWIGLAERKNELTNSLTTAELATQGLLTGEDHETIDANLALYRKAHADMVELRKEYTNTITAGIIDPLMAFEKRVDPKSNVAYTTLAARSLALRKKVEADAAAINAKSTDAANFKAHCQNEFYRVCAAYRAIIRQGISDQYAYSLQEKTMVDIPSLKDKLLTLQIPAVSPYRSTLHTREELSAIYADIRQPDYGQIYAELMEEVDATFANFSSDLANAAAALEHQQTQAALVAQQEQRTLAEETALTTLIATAETVVLDTPKIKRTLSITVVESEQWAKTVMAQFITNMPHMDKYIRVKSWAKLSIGQMAEYLGKYSTDQEKQLPGLQYKTKEA